jgi:dTDP-4-amino-4,6-dideoxygalactose transaminase
VTIRLTIPSIGEEEIAAVREVLESGFLVQGPKVAELEQAVAKYVGVKHAVAVSSGTAALHLSLLALGVGPGDIVVTTAYSWPATANVVEVCGARPVFVDICLDTYNIDPEQLETILQRLMGEKDTARRVKAVLPVHAFGNMADMPIILDLAGRYDLPVVEDAACALGSKLHGKSAGRWGVMGCFSFHPRKAITTGEGGMVTTDNTELAHRIKLYRNHGLDTEAPSPNFVLAGLNYRMTDFQGALGIVQLSKLDRIVAARCHLAGEFNQQLSALPVTFQKGTIEAEPNFQSYVVSLSPHMAGRRNDIVSRLRSSGVEATIGTWNVPLTAYYRGKYGFTHGDFPSTDRVFDTAVTLPLHEFLDSQSRQTIVTALESAISAAELQDGTNVGSLS